MRLVGRWALWALAAVGLFNVLHSGLSALADRFITHAQFSATIVNASRKAVVGHLARVEESIGVIEKGDSALVVRPLSEARYLIAIARDPDDGVVEELNYGDLFSAHWGTIRMVVTDSTATITRPNAP